jgi:hypothetical protein
MVKLVPSQLQGVDLTPDSSGRPTLKGVHGKEIDNTGIFIIGDIHWEQELRIWSCLANVYGRLCIIEVSITQQGELND